MRKIKYKKGRKVVPSILEYTGIHKSVPTEMQLFVYDKEGLSEYKHFQTQDINQCVDSYKVNWLNVHGLNDIAVMQAIGSNFNVDSFMLGDILNTTKRTKLDEYHDILFFNIKSLLPVEDSNTISVEQVSFLLKKGILISFQEKRSDYFTHQA